MPLTSYALKMPAGSLTAWVSGAMRGSYALHNPALLMAIDGIGTGVILCGGRGTRLQEHTRSIPKPLVEIGGRPILWHVIQIYAAQGFDRFLLATGYMGEAGEEFAAAERWADRGSGGGAGGATRWGAFLRHLRRRGRRCRPRRPARLPPDAGRSRQRHRR